jgi:DNA replication and repair protein RecF
VSIRRLELTDFRNYDRRVFEPGEELTVLVGPNATGKTNAIEAIEIVTAARSFRNPRWEDLVRWGSGAARVRMEASEDGVPLEVSVDIDRAGKRVFRVNGQTKRRRADVRGLLPSVIFTPEDLDLVKGSSDRRRNALDDLGEQLSAAYGAVRRDYMRVVRQRNALLREPGTTAADLAPWDEQLVALGARLLLHRTRLFTRVAERVAPIYSELAGGESLALAYEDKSGVGAGRWAAGVEVAEIAERLVAALQARAGEERARQVSLTGPHRDDVVFRIEGKDSRTFASQGQQRTIALAWKLAEVRVVEDVARREPVLLLDDVMSELDEKRRRSLTDLVQRHVQTFVTTTNLGYFSPELLERATVVELSR